MVLALHGDTPAALKRKKGQFFCDLLDGILSKREVLHQHVQALVLFIQELPHPPEERNAQKGAHTK